ncbi:hypothetical protein I6G66_21285 [Delftia acidovorans]|uniref:Uncharacterized protein n=1 Tax=Delftia acidovorans TaxID=80866 RepID=A0A7T2S0U3_DELAC|nr:hypothetical protein [Delftia acidovorans]QPS06825.1 hypothetical protein I6G66_21285 [Delftia acidovorans]
MARLLVRINAGGTPRHADENVSADKLSFSMISRWDSGTGRASRVSALAWGKTPSIKVKTMKIGLERYFQNRTAPDCQRLVIFCCLCEPLRIRTLPSLPFMMKR